ncbi:MAG: metalloregulator ArsR/SmtB family transcription factor [bacterium]
MDDEVFRLHAEVCKIMAHPRRLQIINELRDGEVTLAGLAEALRAAKANVSQHLSQMRQRGIVERRREGAGVFYRLANAKIVKACDLMREVLLEQLEKHRTIADEMSSGRR